jgi:hypothetical protein
MDREARQILRQFGHTKKRDLEYFGQTNPARFARPGAASPNEPKAVEPVGPGAHDIRKTNPSRSGHLITNEPTAPRPDGRFVAARHCLAPLNEVCTTSAKRTRNLHRRLRRGDACVARSPQAVLVERRARHASPLRKGRSARWSRRSGHDGQPNRKITWPRSRACQRSARRCRAAARRSTPRSHLHPLPAPRAWRTGSPAARAA